VFRTATGLLLAGVLVAPATNQALAAHPAPAPAAPAALVFPDMPAEVLDVYLRDYADVPVDVLFHRISLSAARKHLLERFGSQHLATFGGSWYDFRTGVWHLLATTQAAADAMARPARAAGIDVATRIVRYTAEQLRKRAAHIRAGADPMSRVSRDAGVDIMANRVKVAAPPAARTRSDRMVNYTAPGPKPGPDQACSNRRNCGAPLRTGLVIWRGDYDHPECSLGFTASATDGSKWAVTAGHCVHAINELWGHGGQYFGAVRQCGKPRTDPYAPCLPTDEVDVARIKISNPYWLGTPMGYIFYNPTTAVDVDYAILSRYTIETGDRVCMSSWHNNYTGFAAGDPYHRDEISYSTCGTISDPFSVYYGMPMAHGVYPCGGDSGGAWLYYPGNGQRWAYGIHKNGSSADSDPGSICGDGDQAWFSAVPAINDFFDANSAAQVRIITR
jgi:hypothetical protein